jgi:hypothetical protein
MPASITSVFSKAEDFAAAMRAEGCFGLLVTGPGAFRVRLTQVVLHQLRLSAGEEHLPRIALVAVPTDMILVSLPSGSGPAPIWSGIRIRPGEIMTLGASQRLHMRTEGPCRWGAIWLPTGELVRYGGALTGMSVESGSRAMIDAAAAHGLEQQLIHALVECLSKGSVIEVDRATREHQDIAVRFEALLQTQHEQYRRIGEICTALAVSARTLRICCVTARHRSERIRSPPPDAAGASRVAERKPRCGKHIVRSHDATGSAALDVLQPIIAARSASCHPPPCGKAQVGSCAPRVAPAS